MAEDVVKDTTTMVQEPAGDTSTTTTGDAEVVINNNSNITIETDTEGTESVNETTEQSEAPEPTGQDLDGNLQKQQDAQIKANDDLKADLTKRGINWDSLVQEYEETGNLSEKTREVLANAGYPKTVVDAYINGMETQNERFANRVVEFGGGHEKFIQLQNFVKSQSDEYQQMWNDTINTGNLMSIKTMLAGVRSDMQAVYGTANPTITGKGAVAGSGSFGFGSKKEMTDAMKDPRYGKDRAYTHEVERRVMNSKLF